MLGSRFVEQALEHLSFVRPHRRASLRFGMRLHTLQGMARIALAVFALLLPRSSSAQLPTPSITDIIRTQLEARKPPPEPVSVPAPAEVAPPPPLDANADPANDTNAEGTDAAASAPAVVPVPPVKPVKFIPPKLYVGKDQLRAATLLTRFYEGRSYQPAWTTEAGPLPLTDDFVNVVQEEAGREGLQASDYHLAKIKALLADMRLGQTRAKPIAPAQLADLDFLLTDAFFRYGADVSLGQVNLDSLEEKWFTKNDETDLVPSLHAAISAARIADTIRSLPPQQAGYVRLRDALARYRDIATRGGWPTIPAGPSLTLEATGERVAKLRARLIADGDLAPSASLDTLAPLLGTPGKHSQEPAPTAIFDQDLELAVKKFQKRHGLQDHGVVNKETLNALNISAETRTRQIAANMSRWRSLPHDMGRRYIAVNVPNFMLEVVENNQRVLDMKVVVGKMIEERATPTFSAKMSYVVLNPYWYVPKNIAEKELWPIHQRNPNYFDRNNFDIHRIPVGYKQVADPNAADGAKKSVRVYDYVIRQGPGPKNALGKVKFMFPNPYSVYLHDTPSKDLFNRTVRAFSHGCIRIEKPIDLAEYVLRDTPNGSKKAIQATLRRAKEQTVYLPEPLPVHIQYWTAWVDDEGALQFRNDIYHYDRLTPGARLPKAPPEPREVRSFRPKKVRKRVPKAQPPTVPAAPVPLQAAAGQ